MNRTRNGWEEVVQLGLEKGNSQLIQKRIDEIDKPTVDSLVINSVSERRTLDYKEVLPGSGDEDKREFLSDVASFANASGGDIVFGIGDERDDNGRATGVPGSAEGLNVANIGEHKARLESSARDGISPRIQGIQFQPVSGFAKLPGAHNANSEELGWAAHGDFQESFAILFEKQYGQVSA